MKYLKLYEENIENKPKIGDYVICEDKSIALDEESKEFISNNIGKIIDEIEQNKQCYIEQYKQCYIVKYDYNTIPDLSKRWFGSISKTGYAYSKEEDSRVMFLNEIIKFSKNKEDLEDYLTAKKYNL